MSLKNAHHSRSNAQTVTMRPVADQYPPALNEAPTRHWLSNTTAPVAPAPKRHHRLSIWIGGLLAILLATAVALAAGIAVFWTSDWIIPGVQVFGVELGNQSTSEATTGLVNFWRQHPITLDAGDRTLLVPPETLGMTFDVAATVEMARQQGRTLPTLEKVIRSSGSITMPPVWVFDAGIAEDSLRSLAFRFESLPVDASLQIVEGRVVVRPAIRGQRLNVEATMERLLLNPALAFSSGELKLVVEPVDPAVTDVSALAEQANALLQTAIVVRAYDPITDQTAVWHIGPEVWSDWLSLETIAPTSEELQWSLDVERVKAYLLTEVQALGADRYLDWEKAISSFSDAVANGGPEVKLRVYHHATQHIVQSGETLASIGREYGFPYPWLLQANPGISDRLIVGQRITIPSPDELLPLPIVESKRIVVSLNQQRLWAYEDGQVKWEWPASTGIDKSPTSPGVFQIQTHESNAYASIWDLWMPHFLGFYRPVPSSDFMNGFHGFPTRDGANLLWTGDLGHPVTYGCILISTENAAQLSAWAEEGVVVTVQP